MDMTENTIWRESRSLKMVAGRGRARRLMLSLNSKEADLRRERKGMKEEGGHTILFMTEGLVTPCPTLPGPQI
jgi:hypothetical protein